MEEGGGEVAGVPAGTPCYSGRVCNEVLMAGEPADRRRLGLLTAPCLPACKLSPLALRAGGADARPLWPQPTQLFPPPAVGENSRSRSHRGTLAAQEASQDPQCSQEAGRGREVQSVPLIPCAARFSDVKGRCLCSELVRTRKSRVWVVSWTLITAPLRSGSVFDSVAPWPRLMTFAV